MVLGKVKLEYVMPSGEWCEKGNMPKKVKLTKEQLKRIEELKAFHRQMKREGREVDVKKWSTLAHKHFSNATTRDRFIQLLDVFAINVDLLTNEELWFLDDGVELIEAFENLESMDKIDWDKNDW